MEGPDGRAGLAWAGLGSTGLGRAGLAWATAGLVWHGLAWAGLGRAGLAYACQACAVTDLRVVLEVGLGLG